MEEKTIKLAEAVVEQPVLPDEYKRIEISKMVEQKESFTIRDLKNQIMSIDSEIKRMEERKVELEAKIDEVVKELSLTV